MVSLKNIYVVGSFYMSVFGGYKPVPDAFVHYLRTHKLSPKRVLVLGNRLVDMKLGTALRDELNVIVRKVLIQRGSEKSIAKSYADVIVHDLSSVRHEVESFKPDIVLSDFDNTLFFSGFNFYEAGFEKLRFWEKHAKNKLLRLLYGIGSQFSYPFLKRTPFSSKTDNTELFIKTLKCPLLIHTMSPEITVTKYLFKVFGERK